MTRELNARVRVACCVHTVAKVMRRGGHSGEERRERFVRTTDSNHRLPVSAERAGSRLHGDDTK